MAKDMNKIESIVIVVEESIHAQVYAAVSKFDLTIYQVMELNDSLDLLLDETAILITDRYYEIMFRYNAFALYTISIFHAFESMDATASHNRKYQIFANNHLEETIEVIINKIINDDNILHERYVYVNEVFNNEIADFFNLFQSYMKRICHLDIKMTTEMTSFGTVYSFTSDTQTKEDFKTVYSSFLAFLDNPAEHEILSKQGDDEIIEYYVKQARRLMSDIRHKYQRENLALLQRMEDDLLEYSLSGQTIHMSAELAMLQRPSIRNISVQYTEEELQTLEIIKEYGLDNVSELKAALDKIKDPEISVGVKTTEKNKIINFLKQVKDLIAPAPGEVGVFIATLIVTWTKKMMEQ